MIKLHFPTNQLKLNNVTAQIGKTTAAAIKLKTKLEVTIIQAKPM